MITHKKLLKFMQELKEDGYLSGEFISQAMLISKVQKHWGYGDYVLAARIKALKAAQLIEEDVTPEGMVRYKIMPVLANEKEMDKYEADD